MKARRHRQMSEVSSRRSVAITEAPERHAIEADNHSAEEIEWSQPYDPRVRTKAGQLLAIKRNHTPAPTHRETNVVGFGLTPTTGDVQVTSPNDRVFPSRISMIVLKVAVKEKKSRFRSLLISFGADWLVGFDLAGDGERGRTVTAERDDDGIGDSFVVNQRFGARNAYIVHRSSNLNCTSGTGGTAACMRRIVKVTTPPPPPPPPPPRPIPWPIWSVVGWSRWVSLLSPR